MRLLPRFSFALLTFCIAALSSCSGDDGNNIAGSTTTGTGGSGGSVAMPVRPSDPAANDPAFTVTGAPVYLLVGDNLTPATPSFTLHVTPPEGVDTVDLWLNDDVSPVPLTQDDTGFTVTVDATPLALGTHTLMLAERDAD